MTPYEFYLYSKGSVERENDEWQRTAQLASWVLQGWTKNAPSADRLLGKEAAESDIPPMFLDEKDFKAYMKDREK